MASTALIAGSLAASLGSSVIGSNAAKTAASQQTTADTAAIQAQQAQFGIEQQNAAPFVQAGQTSISQLINDLQDGKFNPPAAPQYSGGTFTAPTAAQAEATPGYQFTLDQGQKVLQQQEAAQGQGVSGGEKQAELQYGEGLASTTYQNTFNNALSTYNAGLNQYQAQLAGYGATLQGQAQQFGQELAPAQVGSGQASSINAVGANTANSIAQLMAGIGNSQAAGTVGAANAGISGLSTGTTGITDALLLQKLGLLGNQSQGPTINPAGGLGNNPLPVVNSAGDLNLGGVG
jgi:hypothetical protein